MMLFTFIIASMPMVYLGFKPGDIAYNVISAFTGSK